MIPEVMRENGRGVLCNESGIGTEKKVLNPASIASLANALVSVPERSRFVFVLLRQLEETHSLSFKASDHFHWNSMVHHLKEPNLSTGIDNVNLCIGVREINHRNLSEVAIE